MQPNNGGFTDTDHEPNVPWQRNVRVAATDVKSARGPDRQAAEPKWSLFPPPTIRWEPDGDRWEWSDSLYEMLGYLDPTERPEPALELLLRHQHDRDRGRTEQALTRICRDRQPFVFEHRIVPAQGDVRTVILSATLLDIDPAVVVGTFLDVSQCRRIFYAAEEETVGGLQAEIVRMSEQIETRETVSRAAGILIERHKMTYEQARETLRGASQLCCRKLPEVAAELLYTGRLPAVPPASHRPKPGPRKPRDPSA